MELILPGDPGSLNMRDMIVSILMDDGRVIDVKPQFYNTLVCISASMMTGAWDNGWEYEDTMPAIVAAVVWAADGARPGTEPAGWIRNPTTGRRRPNGDPAREYVHE